MKIFTFIFLILFLLPLKTNAQCDPNVPLYIIDLSANADSTWVLYEEDALDREGLCCTADPNDNCIQFQITLNANSAGVFFDYDGAGAFGSLNWQIDCGPEYNLNDTICLTGGGTFTLTFCKPGSDNGNYTLISVSAPTFPEDQFVPMNCSVPVEVFGVTENSVNWQSISPGAPGDYDYLLDCTDCLTPIYTPAPNGPIEVEFEVCGYPILDYCVGSFDFCDTVMFTSLDSILLNVTPSNPSFCSGGTVQLTANATGGDGNYTYYWYDNSLMEIGTGSTLDVTVAGTYTCEVRDGNYAPLYCDNFNVTLAVVEASPPEVNAGEDQILCADDPTADLYGAVQYATGVIWSGGSGSFSPSNTDIATTYTPTTAEIANGFVILTMTSTGAGSSCPNNSDDIQLFFSDTIQTGLSDLLLACSGDSYYANPTITGGFSPFTYLWNDGTSTVDNTLVSGTHCLTINDANGCQVTNCFNITAPSTLAVSTSSTQESAPGNLDGTVTATPFGGTPPYQYLWSTTGTNQTEIGLGYGIYTVTVTDANGCTHVASVVVNQPSCGFSIATSGTTVQCNGDNNGTATVTTTDGVGPYTIAWNDSASQTNATAVNLTAGVYEVVVSDGNGCIAVSTFEIFEPNAIINSITHTNATVQGGSDGTAQANALGGTGTFNYLWSTSEITPTIGDLFMGWYYLTITDDNGCILNDSVFVNEPPCDEFYMYTATTAPLCNGDLTGEAVLNIVNGVAPFSILWSTGETDVTSISGAPAGIHSVEVIDAEGCYSFLSYGIPEPSVLTTGIIAVSSSCFGADNGTLDLSISGGTYPYQYIWSNDAQTEDLVLLAPGTYQVTVQDQNGCTDIAQATIVEPTPLAITSVVQDVTCFEGSDGAIDVTITGGTIPYSFDWSNGATTEDLSGIDVGGYFLNVTDVNFCSLLTPNAILVNQPDLVEAQTITISCPAPGASQTQVDIVPIGGTADYAISTDGGVSYGAYSNYSVTLDINQTYDIIVMDVNGCLSNIYPTTINPSVSISSVAFNPCYAVGQTDETITVTTVGGMPDYSISTDNGVTFNPNGISAITIPINSGYQLVAMDSLGCLSLPYSITLPDVFATVPSVTSSYNGEDISCNGLSDGTLTTVTSGGTVGYNYSWDTNPSTGEFSTDQNPTGLAAGAYTVTVQDTNGCTTTGSVTITEPTLVSSSISVVSNYNGENISCFGFADGSTQIIASGGVGPYNLTWSNGQTGSLATNLAAGTYSVAITDANNCSNSNSIVVTQPNALAINSVTTDVLCSSGMNGSVDISPVGGVSPYTYSWSNLETTQDISNLTAGTYVVTLTDLNNCILTSTAIVNEPTGLVLDLTATNVSCYNLSDGAMDLSASGGMLPYSYAWNYNSETTEDLTNLPQGNYTVTVTDFNDCSQSISQNVTQPDSIILSAIVINPLCYNDIDGSIDLLISGGTQPYTYDWSNGEITEDLSDCGNGVFTVSVLDSMNCPQVGTYFVVQPDSLILSLFSPFNYNDYNITFNGGIDGSIEVTINGGSEPYVFNWSNGQSIEDLDNLTAGFFELFVTDVNGCRASSSISLIQPNDLELPSAFSPNEDGANDTYVIRGIDAYPDNKITVLNRWGNVIYEEEGYNNTWKGTNENGKRLPDAVYFFILEINSGEIKKDTYVHIKTY